MIYAQFFQRSATDKTKIIEACGDRAVIVLDGRETRASHNHIASVECLKRGYVAWQLMKGDSFTRSSPITDVFRIEE